MSPTLPQMNEQQEFRFADGDPIQVGMQTDDPLLADIAAAWALPVGKRVRVQLKASENLTLLEGRLDLAAAPEVPFDPRQPLSLRVSGYVFSSRSITAWSIGS